MGPEQEKELILDNLAQRHAQERVPAAEAAAYARGRRLREECLNMDDAAWRVLLDDVRAMRAVERVILWCAATGGVRSDDTDRRFVIGPRMKDLVLDAFVDPSGVPILPPPRPA